MTAMEIFEHYAAGEDVLDEIRTKIERCRQIASGCTSQSFDCGGRRSGSNASMKLLDYMNGIDELQKQLIREERKRASDRACCVYLAEMLPAPFGRAMILRYLEGMTIEGCADAMFYSETHTRRILKEAEALCMCIEITWWDGIHTPIAVMRHPGRYSTMEIEKRR